MSLELAVLALIALGIVGLIRGASGPDADQAMAASPVVTVELSTVTPAIAADYQYAADHLAEFAQIPCYYRCDRTVGHRNLADCYVTTTVAWDAHASGRAVCGTGTAHSAHAPHAARSQGRWHLPPLPRSSSTSPSNSPTRTR